MILFHILFVAQGLQNTQTQTYTYVYIYIYIYIWICVFNVCYRRMINSIVYSIKCSLLEQVSLIMSLVDFFPIHGWQNFIVFIIDFFRITLLQKTQLLLIKRFLDLRCVSIPNLRIYPIWEYVFTLLFFYEHNLIQSQFLSRVQPFLNSGFSFFS